MIQFGILGTAQITPAALIYPCMNEPRARINVVAARDQARAALFAHAHHIRQVVEGYDEVVTHDAINAVYNPLHIPAHHPWTLKALNAGKHVLCEKSLACNAQQAGEMNDLAKSKNLILMDAFHYRYHPLFARAKAIYDGGELGEIISIEANFHIAVRGADNIRLNYELGGGVTMDIGCYPVSWVRHLTASEPTVISASAEVGPPNVDLRLETKMTIGDIQITTSGDMRPTAKFRAELIVQGTRGEMRVDNLVAPQMGHQLSCTIEGKTRHETVDRRPSYAYQLDAFIAAVEKGEAPATDGDDAVAQMKVIDRCYEAAGLPLRGLGL